MGIPRLPQERARIDIGQAGRDLDQARDRDLEAARCQEGAAIGDELGRQVEAARGLQVVGRRRGVQCQRRQEPVRHEHAAVLGRPQAVVGKLMPEARDQLVVAEERQQVAAEGDDRLVASERERGVGVFHRLELVDRDRDGQLEGVGGPAGGGVDPRVRLGLHPIGVAEELLLEIFAHRGSLRGSRLGGRRGLLPDGRREDRPAAWLQRLQPGRDLEVVRERRQGARHRRSPTSCAGVRG